VAGIHHPVGIVRMYSMQKLSHSQTGLSVVEALVTMVILMITLGGVYQIFQSNSLTYRMQEGLARVQENGRFAMDFLVNDVRMAGYLGCISDVSRLNIVLKDKTSYMYNFKESASGYEANDSLQYPLEDRDGTWSSSTNSSISKASVKATIGALSLLPGSDILIIRRAYDDGVSVTKDPSKKHQAATIHTIKEHSFELADIVLVSDCDVAAVFQVSSTPQSHSITHNTGTIQVPSPDGSGNVAVGPENETSNLGKSFESGSFYWISTFSFYVALNTSGNPSLYRKRGNDSAQELVEGIESIQLLYGVDTSEDRNVDTYVTAASVPDWSKVRSVKIGLLVSTMDEIRGMDTNTDSYNVLGTSIGPANDMRIRRVFTATVGLRNRLK